MSELKPVFLDLTPNAPRTALTKESFGNILRQRFERGLADAVERIWELPPLILQKPDQDYLNLLVETRELFLGGQFYSCVAMCGIVSERLIKDLLRSSMLIRKTDKAIPPPDDALDQLERIEVSGIIRFLNKAGLLEDSAQKAAQDLVEIRNRYAHARGKDPHRDAIKAIGLLHTLVEATVSIFKDFELTEKGFAPKTTAPNEGG